MLLFFQVQSALKQRRGCTTILMIFFHFPHSCRQSNICRSPLPDLTRPNFSSINSINYPIQNTFHTHETTSVNMLMISQKFPVFVLTLTKGPAGSDIRLAFTHCSPNINATSSVGNKRKCCPFIHLHHAIKHSKTQVQLRGCTWQIPKPGREWQTLQIMWHYKEWNVVYCQNLCIAKKCVQSLSNYQQLGRSVKQRWKRWQTL